MPKIYESVFGSKKKLLRKIFASAFQFNVNFGHTESLWLIFHRNLMQNNKFSMFYGMFKERCQMPKIFGMDICLQNFRYFKIEIFPSKRSYGIKILTSNTKISTLMTKGPSIGGMISKL